MNPIPLPKTKSATTKPASRSARLLLAPGLSILCAAIPMAAETMTLTEEMSFGAHSNADARAPWPSSVASHNGSIYYTWIDGSSRSMVARKAPGGAVTTAVIQAGTVIDKGHHIPSLGVDKDGFVHVVYELHNDPWNYKVSTQANSIVDGFTDVAGTARSIPQTPAYPRITYPYFVRDNNRELFVSFRNGVAPFTDHGQAGGLARYNATTQRWDMLGGTAYRHGAETFLWSNSSRAYPGKPGGDGYQIYRPRLHFDANNRMHVSWGVYVSQTVAPPNSKWSHIMYAHSDDGGLTFKKAGGAAVSALPVTPQNGEIVRVSSPPAFNNLTATGALADGTPFVVFDDGNTKFTKWTGSGWSAPATFPTYSQPKILADRNGVITAADGASLKRSFDGGQSWQTFNAPVNVDSNFDFAYSQETGHVRFSTITGSTAKVYTAVFSGTQPPGGGAPPAAPSNLTATAVSQTQINLVWADNAGNETGFKIERKTGGGAFSQIATPGADATTFNNTGLSAGTAYTYRVRANNPDGDSAFSNEATATTQSGGGGIVPGGLYKLEPVSNPGLRLEVLGGGTADGTDTRLAADADVARQKWTFELQGDGSYELIPNHSTAVRLNVGPGTANGTNVQIWSDTNGPRNRWNVSVQTDGTYELEPVAVPGKRLNAAGDNINVVIWDDTNGPRIRWNLLLQ